MWFLLACIPPAPEVRLPTPPPAEHAEALSADRLLTPTTLGASTDVLCPWARGEPTPDASIVRWLAEERLVWRVYDVEASTLGGRPFDRALELAEAASALDQRCGATLPRDVLVAAGPEVRNERVFAGMIQLSRYQVEPYWLLVMDTTPEAATTPPAPTQSEPPTPEPAVPSAASSPLGPATAATASAEAVAAALASPAPRQVTLIAEDPPQAYDFGSGAAFPSVEAALATSPGCVIVTGPPERPWSATVALADAGRAVGATVELAYTLMADGNAATPAANAGVPSPRTVPLAPHGTLAALRIDVPRYSAPGAASGGCVAAVSQLNSLFSPSP